MLDRTALLSYLKSICDLEKNIPLAEETKKELINESEKLGISRVVKEEPKKNRVEIRGPYKPWAPDIPIVWFLFAILFFSVLAGAVLLVLYLSKVATIEVPFLIAVVFAIILFVFIVKKFSWVYSMLHAFIYTILIYPFKLIIYILKMSKYRNECARAEKEFQNRIEMENRRFNVACADAEEKYKADLAKERLRIDSELAVKDYYMEEVNKLDKSIESMNADLDALYNATLDDEPVLYPTFRNRVIVAQLYDYVASGQCPNLGGMDGAYAQYVQDERTARICTQIGDLENVVKNGIKEIINNQYTICNQIDSMEFTLRDVRNDLYNMSTQLDEHAMMFEKVATDIQEMKNDSTLTQLSKDINGACESANKVLSEIRNNTKYLDPNSSDKHSVDKILTEIRDNTSVLNPDND